MEKMKGNISLIFLNSLYKEASKEEYSDLEYVDRDGEMMTDMLRSCEVKTFTNIDDFEAALDDVKEGMQNMDIERLHFHFSGHGVNNARIKTPLTNKTFDFETNAVSESNTPYGECIVGQHGSLYAVHDLKHKLLEFKSSKVTFTLDCCRAQRRGNTPSATMSVATVLLRNKADIPYEDELKIAVLYAALDLHSVYDSRSLTKELYNVTKKGKVPVPITEITSMVNESWQQQKIKQGCKDDLLEVGNNWKDFYWPMEKRSSYETKNPSPPVQPDSTCPPWLQAFNDRSAKTAAEIREEFKGLRNDMKEMKSDVDILKGKINT